MNLYSLLFANPFHLFDNMVYTNSVLFFRGKVQFSNMYEIQCMIKTILLIFCRILHVTVTYCSCKYMNLILDFPCPFLSFIHNVQNSFILETGYVLNFRYNKKL